MELLQNVLEFIRSRVYMASIGLKDTFYLVSVHKNYQTYLKFFVDEYFKFIYGPAMQIFIKNSKTPFSVLGEKGFLSEVYVDEFYLQGNDYEKCFFNALNTIENC